MYKLFTLLCHDVAEREINIETSLQKIGLIFNTSLDLRINLRDLRTKLGFSLKASMCLQEKIQNFL